MISPGLGSALGVISRRIEHRGSRQNVRVIRYVPRIGPLDHGKAGVMRGRDYPDRNATKKLAHDARVPQRVDRDLRDLDRPRLPLSRTDDNERRAATARRSTEAGAVRN
jgi:hypothetical protein